MAYEELMFICYNLPNRRQTIFGNTTALAGIYDACMDLMATCIQNHTQKKPAVVSKQSADSSNSLIASKMTSPITVYSNGNIFKPSSSKFNRLTNGTSITQQDTGKTAIQIIGLSGPYQKVAHYLSARIYPYMSTITHSSIATTLGVSPLYESLKLLPNARLIVCASLTLTQLSLCSLEEDNLGTAQRFVPTLLSLLDYGLNVLTTYIDKQPDQSFAPEQLKVRTAIENSLNQLAIGFGPWLKDMGVEENLAAKLQALTGK